MGKRHNAAGVANSYAYELALLIGLLPQTVNFGRLDIWGDGLYIKSAKWTFWVITEQ